MKTVCFVLIFAFALENFCASAQQHTVHACKDGTVRLNCGLTGLIQVHSVIHADSGCYGSSCCPRQNDCRGAPSATYRNQVNAACNGQPSCSMNVEIRNIGCGFWAPSNDYTNITYSCIVTQTSPASTIRTITPFPTTPSSSFASTWQHSTKSTSTRVDTTPSNKEINVGQQSTQPTSIHFNTTPMTKEANMEQQSTQSTLTPNNTPPNNTPPNNTPPQNIPLNNTPSLASDERKATEIEKEEFDITPSQSYIEEFTKRNPMHPQKPEKDSLGSEHGKSAALVHTEDKEGKDYGYLDRINTLVAVIVGGVVITAIVISVAVVLALKKRRTVVKSEEQYDMPNFNNQSCNANNDNENVRSENFYDFIPEPAGNCSSRDSGIVEFTPKEDEYLKPILDCEDCEEAPYVWIP